MLSDSSCIMPIGGFAWLACAGLCPMLKGRMHVPLRPAAVLPSWKYTCLRRAVDEKRK